MSAAKLDCVTGAGTDDSVADTGDMVEDLVGFDDNHVQGVPLQFKTAEQLVDLLTGTDKVQMYAEIPRGVKENVWFVVDNTGNAKRREAGRRMSTGMTVEYGAARTGKR